MDFPTNAIKFRILLNKLKLINRNSSTTLRHSALLHYKDFRLFGSDRFGVRPSNFSW